MIIDISNELLTDLKLELNNVLTSYPSSTPNLPCVIVEETSNTIDGATKDSSGAKYCNIEYSVEIFTDGNRRMSEAKRIRGIVDSIISAKYGMIRVVGQSVPNYLDENVYRYVLKYIGKINKNKVIYRG